MFLFQNLLHKCNCANADYLFQQDKFYDISYDTGDKSFQCGRKVNIRFFGNCYNLTNSLFILRWMLSNSGWWWKCVELEILGTKSTMLWQWVTILLNNWELGRDSVLSWKSFSIQTSAFGIFPRRCGGRKRLQTGGIISIRYSQLPGNSS